MGTEGKIPLLHVGGVHEAMIVAPPPVEDALAPPAALTLTEPGLDELHVNGTPTIWLPKVSKTVGVIVREVLVAEVTARVIASTGQVMKLMGRLLAFPIVANNGVRPGTFAVTSTCPASNAGSLMLTVATFVTLVCQPKTPTVAVMSTPLLNA